MKRIISSIVIDNGKAFHRLKFKNNIYLGDPTNICRIFSEKNCDELIIFDVTKNIKDNVLNNRKLEKICENIFIPVCFGGGIYTTNDVDKVFASGIEKIVFKYQTNFNLDLLKYCSDKYGEQSIVVCINLNIIKIRYSRFSSRKNQSDLFEFKKIISNIPHGELLFQIIELSGTKFGPSIELSEIILNEFQGPLIYSGGVKKYDEIKKLFDLGFDAVSCSTLFSLHPITGAPLISYLDWEERLKQSLI